MELKQKHRDVAALLAELRFSGLTQDELAQKCGVVRKTLYNWRQDKAFTVLYQEILSEKIATIEDSPFAQRVDRIHEMFRLYTKMPEKGRADLKAKVEMLKKIAKEADAGLVDEAADLVVKLRHELAAIQGVSPGSH